MLFLCLGHFISRPQETTVSGKNLFSPQLNAQSVGGRCVLNSRLLCSSPQSGSACKFTEPCMCTQRSAAPFPSALTFINLINASGVFVAALNAVISSNTNKCDRSGSGPKLELYICERHHFPSHNTQAVWHWAVPTWTHTHTHAHLLWINLHKDTGGMDRARCAYCVLLH